MGDGERVDSLVEFIHGDEIRVSNLNKLTP